MDIRVYRVITRIGGEREEEFIASTDDHPPAKSTMTSKSLKYLVDWVLSRVTGAHNTWNDVTIEFDPLHEIEWSPRKFPKLCLPLDTEERSFFWELLKEKANSSEEYSE